MSKAGAQRVDDDVADRLADRGVDRDLADRARWVVPPVDVDAYQYQLRLPGREYEVVRVREREPNEQAVSDPGGTHRTCRDARRDQREPAEPAQRRREPVARAVYDPGLDWSAYVSYRCHEPTCRHQCINRRDSIAAEHRYCWEHVVQRHLLPDLRVLYEADLDLEDGEANTPSDGEASIARSGRGANAPAQIDARRKRGLAPDPEAGAHRGDPTEAPPSCAVRSALEQEEAAVSRLSVTKRADDEKREKKPSAR